jgi:hypothetical protein
MMRTYSRYQTIRKALTTANSRLGVAALLLASWPAGAQVACAIDTPCITDLYTSTTNALVVNVNGAQWDVINVRWSRPGRQGEQTTHTGRNGLIEVLKGTTHGVRYTVSVQGCNKHVLKSSTCTDWTSTSVRSGAVPVSNF